MKALLIVFVLTLLLSGCQSKNAVNPNLSSQMPPRMLWAWERPEDLRFIDTKQFGVAFLAQTITLDNNGVSLKPRRQPLETAPGTYIIAVTRIETKKGSAERPVFTPEMAEKIATLVKNTLDLPDVKGVQTDFDAVVSERNFYRLLMIDLKKQLPPDTPLTMTSLASWCTGDAWFNDFPVYEAVPMAFQMGADDEKIKNFLRNSNDWNEPLCRGSYGISIEEGRLEGMKDGRRMYYFKNSPWMKNDMEKLR